MCTYVCLCEGVGVSHCLSSQSGTEEKRIFVMECITKSDTVFELNVFTGHVDKAAAHDCLCCHC